MNRSVLSGEKLKKSGRYKRFCFAVVSTSGARNRSLFVAISHSDMEPSGFGKANIFPSRETLTCKPYSPIPSTEWSFLPVDTFQKLIRLTAGIWFDCHVRLSWSNCEWEVIRILASGENVAV